MAAPEAPERERGLPTQLFRRNRIRLAGGEGRGGAPRKRFRCLVKEAFVSFPLSTSLHSAKERRREVPRVQRRKIKKHSLLAAANPRPFVIEFSCSFGKKKPAFRRSCEDLEVPKKGGGGRAFLSAAVSRFFFCMTVA